MSHRTRHTAAMTARLHAHQYGKAETRLVRIYRDSPRHEIRDLNVTTALRGDFEAAYLAGRPVEGPADRHAEEHGLRVRQVARRRLDRGVRPRSRAALRRRTSQPVSGARVEIEEFAWVRAIVDGAEHDHTWIRSGQEVRTAAITVDADRRARDRRPRTSWCSSRPASEFAGLPARRVHDPRETPRPGAWPRRSTVQWRYARRRTSTGRRVLRRARAVILSTQFATAALARSAADALAHGHGGARRAPRRSSRSARRAQQAPLRWTTSARSGCRTPARSSTPPTGRTG